MKQGRCNDCGAPTAEFRDSLRGSRGLERNYHANIAHEAWQIADAMGGRLEDEMTRDDDARTARPGEAMTPKRKPARLCIVCQGTRGAGMMLFCAGCSRAYDHAKPLQDGSMADAYAWIAERTRKMTEPSPLPRAVRELLRDVVLLDHARYVRSRPFDEWVPSMLAHRAARILGTTPGDIVAKARKAGR